MTSFALALVLLSALCHAAWNLLLKRSGNQEVFAWSLQVAAAMTLLPLGVVLFVAYPISPPGHWLLLATIVTHVSYFLLLGRPTRGATCPWSIRLPGNRPDAGSTGRHPAVRRVGDPTRRVWYLAYHRRHLRGVLVGPIPTAHRSPVISVSGCWLGYAVLTGLTITIYTLVDKQGVAHVQPFLYMYLLTAGSAVGSAPYILSGSGLPK